MGWVRITSMIGILASVPLSLTWVKAGVSRILSRMKSPTPTSTMLNRKGTRHDQSAGRNDVAARKTRFPARSPAGTPICGQLP